MKNSSSERKTKNTKDCQKLKFYQIQINSNINQCFPKQFWCWSWWNGLDYSNIPFFAVYGKSPQGITQSCTSLSQPPQPCCPSGWAGGSAGWDYVTVFAELSSSCWHIIQKEGWRGTNNLLINGVDVILNLIFLFQNITSMLKNFQVAQDVTILHHFAYQKVFLIILNSLFIILFHRTHHLLWSTLALWLSQSVMKWK